MIFRLFASVIFRRFWKFRFDDVIAAIWHLHVAALSRSQLLSIENQQDRSITSGRKSGPRSRNIAPLVYVPGSEVPGSKAGANICIFFSSNYWCYQLRNKSKEIKLLNILLHFGVLVPYCTIPILDKVSY